MWVPTTQTKHKYLLSQNQALTNLINIFSSKEQKIFNNQITQ